MNKYFVWNFDDGLEQDKRIIEILKKYGMGATFNINSGMYGDKTYESRIKELGFWETPIDKYLARKHHILPAVEHFRIPENEVLEVYEGFEIASHTLTHQNLRFAGKRAIKKEVAEDVKNLSEKFGREIVGFAYPYGMFSKAAKKILKKNGIKYARTVASTDSFEFPKDPMELPMTSWTIKEDALEKVERFIAAEPVDDDLFFLMFSHGYEFDFGTKEANWEKFEKICEMVAAHDDIICCSTEEAFRRHGDF